MSAYSRLRRHRQLICDAYVNCGNGAQAYREVNPRSRRPDQGWHKLYANPDFKAAVAERIEEAVTAAGAHHVRFVREVGLLAYARLSQLRGPDSKPLPFEKIPAELLDAAESIEFEPDGRIKRIKIAKTSGLNMMGALMRALPQVHEHTGKNGGPIETKETGELSDLDRARRIAYLLHQGLREAAAKPDTPLSPPTDSEPEGD